MIKISCLFLTLSISTIVSQLLLLSNLVPLTCSWMIGSSGGGRRLRRTVLLQRRHSLLLATKIEEKDDDTNDDYQSPWASSRWQFTMNIGIEEGTYMPEEWGASGGRLVLPFEFQVSSDRLSSAQHKNNPDPMLRRNIFQLQAPLSDTTYITMKGEQRATLKSGGWKLHRPVVENSEISSKKAIKGHAMNLMCFVDLDSDISRNDILLKRGERIYFTGKCWREDALEIALSQMKTIQSKYQRKQQELDAFLDHETGDRRLDGTDPIQSIMGMKDAAQLIIERDEALRKLEKAQRVYPTIPETVLASATNNGGGGGPATIRDITIQDLGNNVGEGPWPGQIEWLTIEPRYLLVRRETVLSEEYHIIGTWTAKPIFDDEDGDLEPSIF